MVIKISNYIDMVRLINGLKIEAGQLNSASTQITPIELQDRIIKSNINEMKFLESLIGSSRIQSKYATFE
jgi:hypothetical protein